MKNRYPLGTKFLAVMLTAIMILPFAAAGNIAFAFYTRSTAMTVCNSSAARGTSTRLDAVNDGGTGSTSFVMLKFENSVVASAAAQSKISLGLKVYTCSSANGSQAAVYYTDDVSKAANYWTLNYNSSTHVSKTMQSLTGNTEKGGTEAMNGVISFFGLKKLDTFAQPKGVTSTPGDYNVYADVTEAVYSANAAGKDLYLFILLPESANGSSSVGWSDIYIDPNVRLYEGGGVGYAFQKFSKNNVGCQTVELTAANVEAGTYFKKSYDNTGDFNDMAKTHTTSDGEWYYFTTEGDNDAKAVYTVDRYAVKNLSELGNIISAHFYTWGMWHLQKIAITDLNTWTLVGQNTQNTSVTVTGSKGSSLTYSVNGGEMYKSGWGNSDKDATYNVKVTGSVPAVGESVSFRVMGIAYMTRLDNNNIINAGSAFINVTVKAIDTSALRAALNYVPGWSERYTEDSYNNYLAVKAASQKVIDLKVKDQTAIDAAAEALNGAIDALETKNGLDYTALDAAAAKISKLDPADYIDFSNIEAVSGFANITDYTTQTEIDDNAAEIEQEILRLVKKTSAGEASAQTVHNFGINNSVSGVSQKMTMTLSGANTAANFYKDYDGELSTAPKTFQQNNSNWYYFSMQGGDSAKATYDLDRYYAKDLSYTGATLGYSFYTWARWHRHKIALTDPATWQTGDNDFPTSVTVTGTKGNEYTYSLSNAGNILTYDGVTEKTSSGSGALSGALPAAGESVSFRILSQAYSTRINVNGDVLVGSAWIDVNINMVDTTSLRDALSTRPSFRSSKYTPESFGTFMEALADASAVLNAETKTQEQIDAAEEALRDAYNGLTIPKTITLHASDADTPVNEELICGYGKMMPSVTPPVRTGYTFLGYFDDLTGGKKYINADGTGAEVWDKDSNGNLFAQWTINTYTIVYDKNADDAVGSTENTQVTYNGGVTIAENGYTRLGYHFTGWNTAADGTGVSYVAGAYESKPNFAASGEFTLYAQWAVDVYTVTFKAANGDILQKTTDLNYGDTVTAPAIPAKSPDETYHYTGAWDKTVTAAVETVTYTVVYTAVAHSGGTATCTQQAICESCGTAYGNTSDHSFTGTIKNNNNGTHSYLCANGCGAYGGTLNCTFGEWEILTPVSCTSDGMKQHVCTVCGYTETQTIASEGHSFGALNPEVPATCVATGTKAYKTCSVCLKNFDADGNELTDLILAIDPDNHAGDTEIKDKVTATCKTDGYTGDTYCLACCEKIASGTNTGKDASNHEGGTEVRGTVTATCKTDGYTGDTYCLGCDAKIISGTNTGKDASNHEGGSEVRGTVTATCKTDGYTGDTYCLGCDAKITSGTNTGKDASKHEGGSEVRGTVTATCKTDGYTGDTYCLGCDAKITSGTNTGKDASKHEGGSEVRGTVTATCKTDGYTGDTYCLGCDAEIASGTNTGKDASNHEGGTYTDTDNETNATCIVPGAYDLVTYCSGCHIELDREHKDGVVDPDKHIGDTEIKDKVTATCKTDGYTGDTYCLDCGKKIASGTNTGKDASNHEGGTEVRDTVTATCKTDGYTGDTYCLGCDVKLASGTNTGKDASAHTGNNHTENAKPASCTEKGYTGDTVCECGVKLADGEEIGLLDHAYGKWTVTVPATCMAKGTERRDCADCDAFETREIAVDPANHTGNNTYEAGKTAPSCTKKGYTGDTVCECGAVVEKGRELGLTAHSMELISETPSTFETAGERVYKCSVCGAEVTEKLEREGICEYCGTSHRTIFARIICWIIKLIYRMIALFTVVGF